MAFVIHSRPIFPTADKISALLRLSGALERTSTFFPFPASFAPKVSGVRISFPFLLFVAFLVELLCFLYCKTKSFNAVGTVLASFTSIS